MFKKFFLNRPVYEILWKNVVELDSPQMTIRPVRIVFWIPKATNTHSEYVILIALPLQQVLHERASLLRYSLSTLPALLSAHEAATASLKC